MQRRALLIFCAGISFFAGGCGGASGTPSTDSAANTVFGVKEQEQKIHQAELERRIAEEKRKSAIASHTGTATAPRSPTAAPASARTPALTGINSIASGRSGVAYAQVGSGRVVEAGRFQTGVAWSTMKVPIAVTVVKAGKRSAAQADLVRAITASDNAAAERLWARLGTPRVAAQAVDATLRNAGDLSTDVQSQRVRAGLTAFGQTNWTLTSQVRFMSGIACDVGAAPVLTLMGQVESDQRWGLGQIGNTRFKGGWGPGRSGRYEVRQMGLVRDRGGSLTAVAIANAPPDGSFATGTANLTRIAQWLQSRLPAGGSC